MSKQYDERQILLRGTGYKLGFLEIISSIMFTELFIVVLLRYLINRKQRKSDTFSVEIK